VSGGKCKTALSCISAPREGSTNTTLSSTSVVAPLGLTFCWTWH